MYKIKKNVTMNSGDKGEECNQEIKREMKEEEEKGKRRSALAKGIGVPDWSRSEQMTVFKLERDKI